MNDHDENSQAENSQAEQQTGPDAFDLLAMQSEHLEGITQDEAQQRIAAAQARQAAAQAAQTQQMAGELLSILELVRMAAAPAFADWWPAYGNQVWNDEQLQAIAHHGAAVMERHGWTLGDSMAKWGPHIALIGATAPPAFATYKAIQWRREEARRAQAPRPPQPATAANDGWHGARNADGSPAP